VGHVKSQASPWYSAIQGDFDQVDYNGDLMATGGDEEASSWKPAFPFGFGLSYTSFDISPLSATKRDANYLDILVNVTNTGALPGKQVVGVYYHRPVSSFVRNHAYLLAFQKTQVLAPSETVTLNFEVPIASLASYDPSIQDSVVEPGIYGINIGPNSASYVGQTFLVTI